MSEWGAIDAVNSDAADALHVRLQFRRVGQMGNPKPGASTEYKCRADGELFVTDDMQARVTGKSEVRNVKGFLLDRLADIRPDDHLKYVNELGRNMKGVEKSPCVAGHWRKGAAYGGAAMSLDFDISDFLAKTQTSVTSDHASWKGRDAGLGG
ncbi:hypothetical protein P7H19_21595 [Paenibacillus larvae]|nr:hypothetical protein [Paenibacillus larvae]MDT2238348.1 hypothetical protein [Paenibacillus larvae]